MSSSTPGAGRALVVGANRGLGLGLVQGLLSSGWEVVATSRNGADTGELISLEKASRARLSLENADLGDPAQIDQLAARLPDSHFDLVILSGATAGPEHRSLTSITLDECAELFFVNSIGPARLAQQLVDRVDADAGVFAFISSVQGSIERNPTGMNALYRASKAALNSLSRSFYLSTGSRFTVLSLHPGWVKTEIGGEGATTEIADSARGLLDVIFDSRGSKEHRYVDFLGQPIPW